MLKKFLNVSLVLAFFVGATLTSCNKEDLTTTVENFTNESMEEMEREGKCGRNGCFEFVFPLTIQFEDESTATAESAEEMRAAIKAWKEANPDASERPSFAFPIEVVSQEGELISIASQEELRALASTCPKSGRGKKGHRGGERCFDLVFPVTILFPDGSTFEAADRAATKTELRAWKEANPDAEERPELQFPITVEMEDGSNVEVASKEDLKALKDECSEGN